MIKSESLKNLAPALSKFQGEITNPKNTVKNPQFNSKYAPLDEILSLVRPLLAKQGLSITQSVEGDLENVKIGTVLLHESGEFLEIEPFTLKGEQSVKGGGKVLNVQGAGSMITYIRRYQVNAILGLASEDDDGEHASKKATPEEIEEMEVEKLKREKIDFTKAKVIKNLIQKSNSDEKGFCKWAKVGSVEEIINQNYTICMNMLERALKEYEKNCKESVKNNALDGVI